MEDAAVKRGPGRPRKTPKPDDPAEVDQLVAEAGPIKPPVAEEMAASPVPPPPVRYKELAEELCDLIIDATEDQARGARYPVCVAALKYALRIVGRRFVQRTSRAAA